MSDEAEKIGDFSENEGEISQAVVHVTQDKMAAILQYEGIPSDSNVFIQKVFEQLEKRGVPPEFLGEKVAERIRQATQKTTP